MSGDDRERAILAAAEDLLRERPLHEISIDEIARAAGISRPGFYFYFASRDAVLLTLLQRLADQAEQDRSAAVEAAGEDPRAQWRAAIQTFYELWRDHRELIRSVEIARVTSDEVGSLWSAILAAITADCAVAIEGERERGAAPDGLPAADLAACLTQMAERMFTTSLTGTQPTVPEDRVVGAVLEMHISAVYGVSGV